MNEIKISTDLHCSACVAKLSKVLDNDKRIQHWNADLKQNDKPVFVKGNISETEVKDLITQAGFKAKSATAEIHPAHDIQSTDTKKFWRDRKIWRKASFNTFNCLVGCTIGDFGMIIFLQVYYPQTPMWLQMMLAIIAGLITSVLLESAILRFREKLVWRAAISMAISMSFISMVGMEIVMNITDFMITGGKAQIGNIGYWLAFIPAAAAGFLAPLPYNYYRLKKYNASCH